LQKERQGRKRDLILLKGWIEETCLLRGGACNIRANFERDEWYLSFLMPSSFRGRSRGGLERGNSPPGRLPFA